jgi:hypothetical protein
MVSAKLMTVGDIFRVYLMTIDGKSEIQDFFDAGRRDPSLRAQAVGFATLINYVADFGISSLTDKQIKCWRQSGEMLYELRKGRDRISAFFFQRGLLMTTHFRKTRNRETAEYDRAVRMKRRFEADGIWED